MEIKIVQSTYQHAIDLAPVLRKSDVNEVMASGGMTPLEALASSVHHSEVCWTALLDGQPHIMWGAARVPTPNGSMGVVWLLSSEEMYKITGRFIAESKNYVYEMFQTFDTLFNYVHAANIKSQQWLKMLGFDAVEYEAEYGVAKEPFILFARTSCANQ